MRGFSHLLASVAFLSESVLAANPFLHPRAACNADNCARAVTGTANKISPQSRSADCASFLAVTVTPATSTILTTTTTTPPISVVSTSTVYVVTGTETVRSTPRENAKVKRATTISGAVYNSASLLPAYISTQCGTDTTALSRYSSACSCFSVSAASITVATPLTTSIITQAAATPLTTVTTTVSTAATTTTVLTYQRIVCNAPGVFGGGQGGCPSNCFCDAQNGNPSAGYCNTYGYGGDCGNQCNTNDDCPGTRVCLGGFPSTSCHKSGVCAPACPV